MSTRPEIHLRDLHSLDDCRAVVAIQEAVWGRDGETVPASLLLVSAKRGGILMGAFAADDMVAFVWSLAGIRDSAPTQWSHMLGVLAAHRKSGVAERLKLAQRDRALSMGVEVIEWTFDPLQAANAHLNLHVLGAVGASYGVDVYGALAGPLHRGTPTDRLIVEWRIGEAHVDRRVRARGADRKTAFTAVSADVLDAPLALRAEIDGEWIRCAGVEPALTYRRVLVPIPPRFSEMQQLQTDLALDWRLKIREVVTAAFERGYRAVDFYLDRETGGGLYLLARAEDQEPVIPRTSD